MTKRLFHLILIAIFTFNISAQDKLSLRSRAKYNSFKSSKSQVKAQSINSSTEIINAFITLNENIAIDEISATSLGMTILSQIDDIAVISIPLENIELLENNDAITHIEFEQPLRLLCDSMRNVTNINQIHNGYNLPQAFKGKDVIVGIVDSGIDYNHINFKDKNKKSRIKRAGVINSKNKTIDVYEDSASIAKLTSDYKYSSHGTHVAGIATGSYYSNNLYGVAPECDILLYGIGDMLYTTTIVTAITDIFNYAEQQGKPAVVNVSIGTSAGSHDGTSVFNRAIDRLSKEGNIVVIASGNEGDYNLYIKNTFAQEDTTASQVASIIDPGSSTYLCEIDAWSHSSEPFGIQYFIYDTNTKNELSSSQLFYPNTTSSKNYTWSGLTLANFFNGTISIIGGKSSLNNRYEFYTIVDGTTKKSNYRIGVRLFGKKNTVIEMWGNGTEFSNFNNSKYTNGSPDGSFNDLATSEETICIGAYSSKRTFTTITGDKLQYPGAREGYVASFSSYGTDINGRNYPDVVAPGYTVVSSVNKHDNATISARQYLVSEVSFLGDRSYHWGDMAGTSMATPVATGTIALWLQADPTLTPQEIKEIFKQTATTDKFTQTGNSIKWGAGKLNGYAGLVHILQGSSSITDIKPNNEIFMLYPNPSNGNFSFYAHNEESVNLSIYSLNGSVVYQNTIHTDNGHTNVNLEGKLIPGIYIVNVTGKFTAHSSRLIIK